MIWHLKDRRTSTWRIDVPPPEGQTYLHQFVHVDELIKHHVLYQPAHLHVEIRSCVQIVKISRINDKLKLLSSLIVSLKITKKIYIPEVDIIKYKLWKYSL